MSVDKLNAYDERKTMHTHVNTAAAGEEIGRGADGLTSWPACGVELIGRLYGSPTVGAQGGYQLKRLYRKADGERRRAGEFWSGDLLVAEYLGSADDGEYLQQLVPILIPTAALPQPQHRQRLRVRARLWREGNEQGASLTQVEAFAVEPLADDSDEQDRLVVRMRGEVGFVSWVGYQYPWGRQRFHRMGLKVSAALACNGGAGGEQLYRETVIACQVADDVPGSAWLLRSGNQVALRGRLMSQRGPQHAADGPPNWRVDVLWVGGEQGSPLNAEEAEQLRKRLAAKGRQRAYERQREQDRARQTVEKGSKNGSSPV
jgi:hypothetical protein